MSKSIKQQLNFLDETIKFYGDDVSRRSLNSKGHCKYKTESGNKCAIGRCLKKIAFDYDIEGNDATGIDNEFKGIGGLEGALLKKYQGFTLDFWNEIQGLHDGEYYWDMEGLTGSGYVEVERIKKRINRGNFKK